MDRLPGAWERVYWTSTSLRAKPSSLASLRISAQSSKLCRTAPQPRELVEYDEASLSRQVLILSIGPEAHIRQVKIKERLCRVVTIEDLGKAALLDEHRRQVLRRIREKLRITTTEKVALQGYFTAISNSQTQ